MTNLHINSLPTGLHVFCNLLTFSKITFFEKISKTIRVQNSLDPESGPNCLQKISADDTSNKRVRTNSER